MGKLMYRSMNSFGLDGQFHTRAFTSPGTQAPALLNRKLGVGGRRSGRLEEENNIFLRHKSIQDSLVDHRAF
jgi:hypothetical protein